jgi:programmed cell death protein 5
MEGLNLPDVTAQKRQEEEMKKAHEEQRELYLSNILTPEARERLNRVALVKPEKAR